MNKSQLINKISANSCISKTVVNRVLNIVISSVIKSLKDGDHVALIGFGVFIVKVRMPRSMKSPKTGEVLFIQASKIPVFRAGKKLKRSVNS